MTESTVSPRHAARNDLTAEYARSLVHYDAETGYLIWKKRCGPGRLGKTWDTRFAGKVAGVQGASHVYLKIKGAPYLAHRLAWLVTHGSWPATDIDHINGDGFDNRIVNLRLATPGQNAFNKKVQTNNTSGHPGVVWCKAYGKWTATIKVRGRNRFLGNYAKYEDAVTARRAAEKSYFGEFRRGADNEAISAVL
jgi:hypothetical protein